MRVSNWINKNRGVLLEALIILVVALVPRLYGIGLFLTADEKNWVGRSAEFIKAWRHLRINDTLQTTHPGITVLWVSGLAVYTAQLVYHTVFNFNDILKFASFVQVPMAVVNSLLVVAVFILLRKLLPRNLAFIAGLALALEPYVIGFSKLVHVDAFLTGFLTVTVLLLILYDKTKSRKTYWLSAIFAALAILTKLPAIVILPFAGILFIFRREIVSRLRLLATEGQAPRSQRQEWYKFYLKQFKLYLGWIVIVVALVVLLWPSLWWVPHPLDNIGQVGKDMKVATTQPHDMDEPYTLNAWHYPSAMIARSSVSVLLGLVALAIMLAVPKFRKIIWQITNWRTLFFLALFILMFVVEMTIGAKKGDRYVLPVFPAMVILGTMGVYGVVGILLSKIHFGTRPRVPDVGPRPLPDQVEDRLLIKGGNEGVMIRIHALLTAIIVLGASLIALAKLGPYQLAYYNPLFPPNLSQEIGWGEGFDKVAEYLDSQPDKSYVASWYPEELRALTKKRVLHINAHQQNQVGYVVLYRNMFGRSADHWANDFIDEYYKKRKPDFTAMVNGLEYAWVYKKPVVNGIIGEILPGHTVVVKKQFKTDNLSAVSVAVATYSGKATNGSMTLHVRTDLSGPDLRTVTIDTKNLQDGGLTKFSFEPLAGIAGKDAYFIFTTTATRTGNAPTLRIAKDEPNAFYSFIKSGPVNDKTLEANSKPGWLGLDWYFMRDGKEISQLEVK